MANPRHAPVAAEWSGAEQVRNFMYIDLRHAAVLIAKLTYAAPAWWGFASADDRKRLEAFMRRGVRLDLYTRDEPTINELVEGLDNTLFHKISYDETHIISSTIYFHQPLQSLTI